MSRNAAKHARPIVAIEIRHSRLIMTALEPVGPNDTVRVRSHTVSWRQRPEALHSELSAEEVTAALKTLVAEERLAGAKVRLVLSADSCVTRVVTGSKEHVRREMAALEERSAVYLSLGSGPKSLATHFREVDARHRHALLSVANSRTIDLLLEAANEVGLTVEVIEPSLVALCRLLGYTGSDADQPVLIVNLSENGAEMGISHRGQLLLHYAPGGRFARAEVAGTVCRHLTRLERYCDRHYGYAEGKLDRVFVSGSRMDALAVSAGFAHDGRLRAEVLDPTTISPQWQFSGPSPEPDICAALGSCLVTLAPDRLSEGPNLLERIRTTNRRPLVVEILRAMWPAAAALLVAVGLMAANWREQSRCKEVMARMDRLEPAVSRLWKLRREIAEADLTAVHLEELAKGVADPSWKNMLSTVAQCAPDCVWLDKLSVDSNDNMKLVGSSYSESAIYQFERSLQASRGLSHVAVEGTRPGASPAGPVTKFDIQCEIANYAGEDPELNHDD